MGYHRQEQGTSPSFHLKLFKILITLRVNHVDLLTRLFAHLHGGLAGEAFNSRLAVDCSATVTGFSSADPFSSPLDSAK